MLVVAASSRAAPVAEDRSLYTLIETASTQKAGYSCVGTHRARSHLAVIVVHDVPAYLSSHVAGAAQHNGVEGLHLLE